MEINEKVMMKCLLILFVFFSTNVYSEARKSILLEFGNESNEAPRSELVSLYATIKGIKYQLDTSRMYNAILSDGRGQFGISCMESNPDYCIIRGKFGDGAGSYAAEWHLYKGDSFRTILTTELDIQDELSSKLKAYKW